MLTNPRDAFRSIKVTKRSNIPYVRYSFLLCSSNFVFKKRQFSDIRLQKMSGPWNPGQRSLKVIESGTILQIWCGFLLVFYRNSVREMHGIRDIRLQKCRDLETGLGVRQGHWKCHHVIERIWLPIDVLYSIYGSISCRFWDIQCRKCHDLEIGVRGHSRSLNVVRFDRLCMVSYFSVV